MAEKNFEKSMAELEETVKLMEGGNVPLNEALSLFEKGIKLSKECQNILENAEKKVSVLLAGENGEIEEKPFADLPEE